MKKYLVLGASPNLIRHSYKAVKSLARRNLDVVPVGYREGVIADIPILLGTPDIKDVDTVLLYLGAKRQVSYYEYILSLKPKKIVFNPGTENIELQEIAKKNGIEVVVDCALVMINASTL